MPINSSTTLIAPSGATYVPISQVTDGALNRLAVDAKVSSSVTLAAVPYEHTVTAAQQLHTPLKLGAGVDLRVNGSTTNAVFSLGADPTKTIMVTTITTLISSTGFNFTGNRFINAVTALTNGLLYEIVSAGVATTLATVKISEDFLCFNGTAASSDINLAGANDIASMRIQTLTPLVAASSDVMRVTVRDNLTVAAQGTGINFLQVYVTGTKI